jgi:rhodanese-related sulfurtransferase
LPIEELERRLDEVPDDREIVAYCRGRYCVYSDEAVRLLRARGFRARRLETSARDWEQVH